MTDIKFRSMDVIGSTSHALSTAERSHQNDTTSPLVNQMRSMLRLDPRTSDLTKSRGRRYSDGSRPSHGVSSAQSGPIVVVSSDRTRWLPTPDEQSQIHRPGERDSVGIQLDDNNLPLQPLVQHSCSSAVCAVKRVFETTELLELLLSSFDTQNVLALRRTSKHWDATIHQSPYLRLHFFTYGQWSRPGACYQLLPLSIPGLSIELGEAIHLGRWVEVSFTPEAARRISPDPKPNRRVRSRSIFEGLRGGLGSRSEGASDSWPGSKTTSTISSTLQYEDLLITQPPVLGMQAFIILPNAAAVQDSASDQLSLEIEPRACAKLWCDTGITLGFLAETAQSLIASQNSGPSNMEEATVVFKAIISFCSPNEAPKKRTNTRSVTRL